MAIEKEDLSCLNALFTFLSSLESVVFWVCTADYSRQIYINESYDYIWGRSRETLLTEEGFKAWKDSLVIDDVQHNLTNFYRRSNIVGVNGMVYRVHRPEGDMRFIKDISCTLADQTGENSVIVGVAEMISPERWEKYYQSEEIVLPEQHILKDCVSILKKEYSLLNEGTPIVQKIDYIPDKLIIDGQEISFNRRQRECLYYLLQGYTAKQTANEMYVSPRTVETYIEQLKVKLKCCSKLAVLAKFKNLS